MRLLLARLVLLGALLAAAMMPATDGRFVALAQAASADGPVVTATVVGLTAGVGPAFEQDIPADCSPTVCPDPRVFVYQLVPVALANATDEDLFVSDLDFRLLASDATVYSTGYCGPYGWGLGRTGPSIDGTPVLHPGATLVGGLCYSVPRGKTPAAVYWDPPFRVDNLQHPPHPSNQVDEQLLHLPPPAGQPSVPLRPAGPLGTAAGLGVSVSVGTQRWDPAPQWSYGVHAPGAGVAVVHIAVANGSPYQIDASSQDFVLLDAQAVEYASTDADAHVPAASGAMQPGQQAEADVAFEVPAGLHAFAIRWSPRGLWGDLVPGQQIVLLPAQAG